MYLDMELIYMIKNQTRNPRKAMEETLEQVRLKLVQINSLMLALADASYYSNWKYMDALYHVECQLDKQIKILKEMQEKYSKDDDNSNCVG